MYALTKEVNYLHDLKKASLSHHSAVTVLPRCTPRIYELGGGGVVTLRLHNFMFDFENYVIQIIS
jgi:hypothetical protein